MKKFIAFSVIVPIIMIGILSCCALKRSGFSNDYGSIESRIYLIEQYPLTILNEIIGVNKKDSSYVHIFVPSNYTVPYLDMNYCDIRIRYRNEATIFLCNYPFKDNPDIIDFVENSECKGLTVNLISEFQNTLHASILDSIFTKPEPQHIECCGISQQRCWRFIRTEYVIYGYFNVPQSDRFYFNEVIDGWRIEHIPPKNGEYLKPPFHGLIPVAPD